MSIEELKEQVPLGSTIDEYCRNTMILFNLLKPEHLYRVKKAVEDAEFRAHGVDESDKFILDVVENIITFQPEKKPEIAKIFGIAADSLDKLQIAIEERIRQEDSACLPGLEPSKEDRLAKAALKLYEQGGFAYPALMRRGISKLDRRIPCFPDSGAGRHTLDVAKNKELSIRWNILNGARRVAPFDQEVESAVSNIVEAQGGKTAVTYEQIYCSMNGVSMDSGKHITKKAIEEIRDSVFKLNSTGIEITEQSKAGTVAVVRGRVLDAVEISVKVSRGKIKSGVGFTRPGLLFIAERDYYKRLLSVTREQLNIGAGGVSITKLAVEIRRYLLMEIFRIKNTPSMAQGSNTVTYDAIIQYEADPELVEYSPSGDLILGEDRRAILKTGADREERKRLTKARRYRAEVTLKILAHFKQTGLIRGFSEITDSQKRKYGVVLDVDKTEKALGKIKKAADLKKLQG